MRTYMLQKEFVRLSLILFLSIIVLLGMGSWTSADENISVTCYKDGSRIGTTTVFDWRTAAAACNMSLYDCRGACMGCFRDNDYITDVCIDTQGREFLR